jgi:hypothetical protein
MAVQHGHAFATNPHGSARLHSFGDFQSVFAFQGGNANLSSERSLAEGNRNDAMQVGTFALEERMLFNMQNHIKIASRTTKGPGFAQAGETDASTVFHSCRDLGLDGPLTQNPALPFALGARISDNTAGTLAGGAGTSHAEESLLVAHLSPSRTGAAGDRGLAGSSARTAAIFTGFVAADGDLGLLAEYCLLELQRDVLAQIRTTLGTGASAPTAAKEIAKTEEVAKNLAEILDRGIESCRPSYSAYSGVPEAVVGGAFVGICQNGVGFAALFELFFRVGIIGIAIGVELKCQLAIGALDFLLAGPPGNPEDLVVIAFYVAGQNRVFAFRRL